MICLRKSNEQEKKTQPEKGQKHGKMMSKRCVQCFMSFSSFFFIKLFIRVGMFGCRHDIVNT